MRLQVTKNLWQIKHDLCLVFLGLWDAQNNCLLMTPLCPRDEGKGANWVAPFLLKRELIQLFSSTWCLFSSTCKSIETRSIEFSWAWMTGLKGAGEEKQSSKSSHHAQRASMWLHTLRQTRKQRGYWLLKMPFTCARAEMLEGGTGGYRCQWYLHTMGTILFLPTV